MNIRQAHIEDVPDLIPLFDEYRMFYRQHSDYVGAKHFLTDRITKNESLIYLVYIEENAVGFMQLYPIYSSVSMESMYVLNDLFIEDNYRGQGIGSALIKVAKDLCIEKKFKGLALQTETTNPAQHLYESLDFKKDPDLHYFWTNTDR